MGVSIIGLVCVRLHYGDGGGGRFIRVDVMKVSGWVDMYGDVCVCV